MNNIKTIMKEYYEIESMSIVPLAGGWASLAYKVADGEKTYFLKIYEKNRSSTPKLVEKIDQYVPILHWLVNHSALSGKVALPCLTNDGKYKCEDDEAVYLLYNYIDGSTIGDQLLSGKQIDQLSEIVAVLHSYSSEIPFVTDSIREDFHVPYAHFLLNIAKKQNPHMTEDIRQLVSPYISQLLQLVMHVECLSVELKKRQVHMALCHTDLHNWNMIQTNSQLVLIDWEGLKLAPIEADLFFLINQPFYPRFLETYLKTHSQFKLNQDALHFYQGRRKLEDIGEFIEQLFFDPLDQSKRASIISSLGNELLTMNESWLTEQMVKL